MRKLHGILVLSSVLTAAILGSAPASAAPQAALSEPPSGTQVQDVPIPKVSSSDGAAVLIQPERRRFSVGVKFAKLQVTVIDGRTRQPLKGAEVVIPETGGRYRTGADGTTPIFDAPVIRNPRYEEAIAELHGQLTAIVYKDGYHDSVHFGIRMHEGKESNATVWMYKLEPGDRVEPIEYQVPFHRLWLIELADRFRRPSQPGEGPERPS